MSTLGKFLETLLPRLNKSKVAEDIRITRGELENIVEPTYKEAVRFFTNSKSIKSEDLKEITVSFMRNIDNNVFIFDTYKNRKRENIVLSINDRIPNLIKNTKEIESKIEDLFEKDIIRDGLTAKKAALLRAAEYLSFISRYSIDLINYIYNEELYTRSLDDSYKDMPPIKVNLIKNNITNYANLLNFFSIDPEEFKDRYNKIPDIFVNIKEYTKISAVYEENILNPVSAPTITGFEYSPIYHIGMLWAEWQASRYKAYSEKKQMLELKRLALDLEDSDRKDPKIQKQIKILNERITEFEYKMASIEGK